MGEKHLFTTGQFATLARTTHKTLHHYDEIGLLPAAKRGENNYRYYSSAQLSIVNLIRVLQELGMSLNEISEIREKRTPEFLNKLYASQMEMIDQKIEDWMRARKLLATLQKITLSALDVEEPAITIQFLQAEAIILGNQNDYSKNGNDYDALLDFYFSMRKKFPDLDLNYPVWGLFSKERIKNKEWNWPDRYYFYNPEGHDKRPADLYAVGYTRGNYGQTDELYKRMLDYIDEHGFEVCGDAYEEYPLNEICISDSTNYLIRVMITVCKKD